MYLSYLILKKNKTDDSIIQIPSNMTIELILFLLSIKYYNYDISKICNALFSNTSTEYEEIINNLRNEQRENIYNYLLKCAANFLKEYDKSMLDNLELIIDNLTQKYTDYMNIINSDNSKLNDLKKLSEEEFDELFIDFLCYINAPKEWFELYKKLKNDKLINFKFSNDIENGLCFFDSNEEKWKLSLISDGTIRTFIILVHEFMHYVENIKNNNINFSLREFPSIYFEHIAAEFLKGKGYDEKIIEETLNKRNLNNFDLFGNQILQLKEILCYKKNGLFSIEKRVEFYRNWIKGMNDFKINMVKILKSSGIQEIPDFLQTLYEKDPVEIVYSEIDAKIDEFVESGLLILDGIQYLVGSLLSGNVLENIEREKSNSLMIDIINQLGKHTINSIIQLFEINISNEQNIISEKCFKKKLLSNDI